MTDLVHKSGPQPGFVVVLEQLPDNLVRPRGARAVARCLPRHGRLLGTERSSSDASILSVARSQENGHRSGLLKWPSRAKLKSRSQQVQGQRQDHRQPELRDEHANDVQCLRHQHVAQCSLRSRPRPDTAVPREATCGSLFFCRVRAATRPKQKGPRDVARALGIKVAPKTPRTNEGGEEEGLPGLLPECQAFLVPKSVHCDGTAASSPRTADLRLEMLSGLYLPAHKCDRLRLVLLPDFLGFTLGVRAWISAAHAPSPSAAMRLQLLSDLHLETETFEASARAGRRGVGAGRRHRQHLGRPAQVRGWPVPVILVPGNHEFERRELDTARAACANTPTRWACAPARRCQPGAQRRRRAAAALCWQHALERL